MNDEYNNIKNKIEKLIWTLKGLNIENKNFNFHLYNIQNELLMNEIEVYLRKRNKSVVNKKLGVVKDNEDDNNNLLRNQMKVFFPNLIKVK